jgi:hypothetical protein
MMPKLSVRASLKEPALALEITTVNEPLATVAIDKR